MRFQGETFVFKFRDLSSQEIISLPLMGGSVVTGCVGVGPCVIAAPSKEGGGTLRCLEEATCSHNFISPVECSRRRL